MKTKNGILNYWLIESVEDELNVLCDGEDYDIEYSERGIAVTLKWDLTRLNYTWEDIDNKLFIKSGDRYYFFHESYIPTSEELNKLKNDVNVSILIEKNIKDMDNDNFKRN